MKKRNLGILLSISVALVCLCTQGALASGLVGSGKLKSENRKLPEYHSISLKLPGEMIVDVGSNGELSIEADDNLLSHIKTDVKNGALIISADQSLNNMQHLHIKAKTAKLDAVTVDGAATTTINNAAGSKFELAANGASTTTINKANCGSISVSANGASKIIANGKAEKLNASLNGAGNLQSAELSTKSSNVSITGAGGAEVNASNDLDITITGAGDVKYKGNPKLNKHVIGAGSVEKF
jgi:hypothetical protein